MEFVGNYTPSGLSPQMYDMPIIQKKDTPGLRRSAPKEDSPRYELPKAVSYSELDLPWITGVKGHTSIGSNLILISLSDRVKTLDIIEGDSAPKSLNQSPGLIANVSYIE